MRFRLEWISDATRAICAHRFFLFWQVTRIERPKERSKEMDVPVKDEIEVVPVMDMVEMTASRGLADSNNRNSKAPNRRSLRPKPDKVYTENSDDEVRINGYSNGYGSTSDMEVNDIHEEDVESDDDNLEDLPLPPSPRRKVGELLYWRQMSSREILSADNVGHFYFNYSEMLVEIERVHLLV